MTDRWTDRTVSCINAANKNISCRTFLLHAELEAFLEPAVLALVAMVLVDWTVVVSSTRVRQVSTHRTLEEALTSLTRQYSVMFARTLVTADYALEAGSRDKQGVAVLDRRVGLRGDADDGRRSDGGRYPEGWRTDVIVIVVVGGSRVGYATYFRASAHQPAVPSVHALPSSASNLQRPRPSASDNGHHR